MEAAVRTFFSSSRFAVAGASSDPSKFGHRVFDWYLIHSLTVTPLNPKSGTISVQGKGHPAVASVTSLPEPTNTSLSIITPPKATLTILREAKSVGIPAVWLQPGSFDDECWDYAKKEFQAAIGGMQDRKELGRSRRGDEGWCILVDGEWGMGLAGKGKL